MTTLFVLLFIAVVLPWLFSTHGLAKKCAHDRGDKYEKNESIHHVLLIAYAKELSLESIE